MAQSQSYDKTRINDSTYSLQSRMSAIYDYVGAVYGAPGKVQYDGKLTDEEREEVEATFGKLELKGNRSDKKTIDVYIAHAQAKFLDTLPPLARQTEHSNACQKSSSDFTYQLFSNKKLGKGYSLGGVHNCTSQFGVLYLQKGVELEVAAHPESWIFFLEGYDHKSPNKHDITFFEKIAQALHIPIYEPLPITVMDKKVFESIAQKRGRNAIDYAAIASLSLFLTIAKRSKISADQIDQVFFGRFLGSFNQSDLHMREQDLREAVFTFLTGKKESSINFGSTLLEQNKQKIEDAFAQFRDDMEGASNELNVVHVKEILRQHPQQKRALYQTGDGHEGLVRNIYSSSK